MTARLRRSAVLAVGAALAAGAAGAEPTLSLRFAWPEGFRARCEYRQERVRSVGDQVHREAATARYSMRLEPRGEGFAVRFEDVELEPRGDVAPGVDAQVLGQIAGLVPDYAVTRRGEFAGILDLPRFRAALLDVLRRALGPALGDEAIRAAAELFLSEDYLESEAAEQWNAWVGAWAGAELVLGETRTHSAPAPVPVLEGREILMHYRFGALRRVACLKAGGGDCVELAMDSAADPGDTARALGEVMEQLGGEAAADLVFESLDVEAEVRVVTEPATLVPHRYRQTKSVRGTLREGGRSVATENVDTREARCAPPGPAGAPGA